MPNFICSLSGGNLLSRINQTEHLGEVEIMDYIHQILVALKYMHSITMVHEDIKPENVVFATRNSNVLKLVDLGLAKYNLYNRLDTAWGYKIPREVIKPACDMWRVGVMTYRL